MKQTTIVTSVMIVLLAIFASASAQTPVEVKTNDGRIVILKPDGTWEYKRDTAQPSPSPAQAAASANKDSFPPNFTGQDVKLLSSKLSDLKTRLTKNEFETTAEYDKRVADEIRKPIIDNLTLNDTFYLVVSSAPLGLESTYNADSQKMNFFVTVWKNERAEIYRRYGGRDKRAIYDLTDANLYQIHLDSAAIFFDDTNGFPLSKKFWDGFSADVPLNVEEAKRIKKTARAAILVKFEEPYALRSYRDDSQLQVRLIDVYFFDQQTGKILAKMSQSEK
jgi:hypothetical protein